jgi:hypothetical protein
MKWMGKSNSFGGSVDLGILRRIPKGLQVLVSRMEDLVILSSSTKEEREWKALHKGKNKVIYRVPRKIAIGGHLPRVFGLRT